MKNNTDDYLQKIPFIVNNTNEHTMGEYLHGYIDIKLHHLAKNHDSYDSVTVVGKYDRSSTISKNEKTDKVTNWQRPTAKIANKVLTIECFPGKDYVKHYASMYQAYFNINSIDKKVTYIEPTDSQCWEPILSTPLIDLEPTDFLIFGFGLQQLFGESDWIDTDTFLTKTVSINQRSVTLLIYKHSFWGDISGRIITQLAKNGFDKIIFTGKLGGMKNDHIPNQHLATGNTTLVESDLIHWKTPFSNITHKNLKTGVHLCLPSVLQETKDWYNLHKDSFDFVDPEIGRMAKAAKDAGIKYGYLHIISDTLARLHDENLSNERDEEILKKRKKLVLEDMIAILKQAIS